MDLHGFYVGIKDWAEEDLHAILAQVDVSLDDLYPRYHQELENGVSPDDDYVISLRDTIEDYELIGSIANRELENR